jgi:hypothetical protein
MLQQTNYSKYVHGSASKVYEKLFWNGKQTNLNWTIDKFYIKNAIRQAKDWVKKTKQQQNNSLSKIQAQNIFTKTDLDKILSLEQTDKQLFPFGINDVDSYGLAHFQDYNALKTFGNHKTFLKAYYDDLFAKMWENNQQVSPISNLAFSPEAIWILENNVSQYLERSATAVEQQPFIIALSKAVKKSSKIPFSGMYNTRKYKFIVTQGNNSKLIREAMQRRPWWIEIPKFNSIFNFKWQPTSFRMKFHELRKERSIKQVVNHLEFHKWLSEKSELFRGLREYWKREKRKLWEMIPLTFLVKLGTNRNSGGEQALNEFYRVFEILECSKKHYHRAKETKKANIETVKVKKRVIQIDLRKTKNETGVTKFKPFKFQTRGTQCMDKYEMPISHYAGENFWIFKATNLNRGRGIHVFGKLYRHWRFKAYLNLIQRIWKK